MYIRKYIDKFLNKKGYMSLETVLITGIVIFLVIYALISFQKTAKTADDITQNLNKEISQTSHYNEKHTEEKNDIDNMKDSNINIENNINGDNNTINIYMNDK